MGLTTIRIPDELIAQLDELAAERAVTRSDLVREALERYCKRVKPERKRSRQELVRELVDYAGSGRRDGAEKSEEHLRRMFDERRRNRSR